MSPTALRVDATSEGVHARVEVGADAHPEHPRVVPDVDHSRQLMLSRIISHSSNFRVSELPETQQVLHTEQEAGATDAADEYRDLHIDRA
ncbi:hypothetical protein MCEL_20330 [Mycolicibacterium celeriflavum]|uniref:Uncharacterized protein n=1 Tax=Mycolicibacterium celeriflavum TaxID=1249101 RepID=A0A7I7RGN2_MYCCF|nr:hypothetical protein MCEL_20330 [Mycolicibacterium celeriflavum]